MEILVSTRPLDSNSLAGNRQAGFTLLELIVALAVSTTLLILVLNLLDLNTRVGRVQTDLSTVQQAQRVVHNLVGDQVRMAGRGGLTIATALNVADNVSSGFKVAGNDTVDGTDVLRVRGAFENYFEIDTTNTNSFGHSTTNGEGFVRIDSALPSGLGAAGGGGRVSEQNLDDLEDAIDAGIGLALVLVSSQNNATFAVVELLTGPSSVVPFDVDGNGSIETGERRANLVFDSTPSNSVNNALFAQLSSTPGAFPPMTGVANVGILQEYQYYVRDTDEAAEGNRPKLSRAEFLPNTPTVVGDASNGRVDIADNVGDFQVARGFDKDGDRSSTRTMSIRRMTNGLVTTLGMGHQHRALKGTQMRRPI